MSTSDRADLDLAAAMGVEIERLANQLFAGPVAAPAIGPNAANVGAGGASPAVALPPIPGPLHRPPLAATPPPKESDLRALPTLVSENLGFPSPIALASAREPSASPY